MEELRRARDLARIDANLLRDEVATLRRRGQAVVDAIDLETLPIFERERRVIDAIAAWRAASR